MVVILLRTYKLILLPVWIGYYHYQDKRYNVVINGQTGRIKGAKPRGKGRNWLDKLFGK